MFRGMAFLSRTGALRDEEDTAPAPVDIDTEGAADDDAEEADAGAGAGDGDGAPAPACDPGTLGSGCIPDSFNSSAA